MIAIKLAIRNLVGAGLRTWLNVFVLSLTFFFIIWQNGLIHGWNIQARTDMIDWSVATGQYWVSGYDPFDAFTIDDAHAPVPPQFEAAVTAGTVAPVLISQATIYPEGRMQTVLLKGIDPAQRTVQLPSSLLKSENGEIPALIGTRMAASARLDAGDYVLVRWRDANGTFDAVELRIAGVFSSNVPAVDFGQIWIPLEDLRRMKQLGNEATIIIKGDQYENTAIPEGWVFRNRDYLMADLDQVIKSKSIGGSIFFIILLSLALLAVFDTQVLSIFRRQREIGTYIAMGMTRAQVVWLFTVEGTMHALLAALLFAIYGIPLLSWQKVRGMALPDTVSDMGIPIAEKIIPAYSGTFILIIAIVVMITTAIVSYLPSRKIAKMNPTDAIKGKIQ
ncbi:MAG: ABC transporter permease [Bacteroidota bacterium]